MCIENRDVVQRKKYKKYNNLKLVLGISEGVASFILLLLFVWLGLSLRLQNFLSDYFISQYLLFIVFVLVVGLVSSVIFSPLNYYRGFYLEHKYELSNQTFFKWIFENLKSLAVSLVIGIPLLLIFFYALNAYGNFWWLPFAIILFVISVILAQIVPVVILPLFFKVTPLEDEILKEKIKKLAVDAGIKIENIYKFNMSKNTKKANAAFTGLGKTKRILLGDTLLDNYNQDQIETVIAHELGHYKKRHIIKNIVFGTASSFLTLFIIALLYHISISWFGFNSIVQIAAMPVLALWAMLIGVIQTPLGNILSRKYEYEADRYSIESTHKPYSFISTLEKLTDQNLGDKDPHPFIEWFFYSHPSINNRITAIKYFSQENGIVEQNEQQLQANLKGE
jgi:STE24 endopeptidase